jgi:peptidyl-prolyl cis-trans isomerase SurA
MKKMNEVTMRRQPYLWALLFLASTAGAQTLDRVVAVVDNDIILESELNAQIQFFVFNNRVDPETPGLRNQVLQSMVNEKLIVAKAIEDSVTVSDNEVQQQLDLAIQQRVQAVGSETRLEEMYGMPLSRIRREFRDDMRKNLLAQKLQQERFGMAQVGRHEVEEFFRTYQDSLPRVPEEVELAHIFKKPKFSEANRIEARATLQALRDSIVAGADFNDLARRYSEDPGSAPQGGDLGLVRRGLFVKEFESAVFSLAEGQVSEVVETPFGMHLIQLLERRGDAVRARHILRRIEHTTSDDDSVRAELSAIRARALSGENFAELARKYSEDNETNLIGGNLGTFDIEQLDAGLAATVAPLKEGDISEPARLPVGSGYGFHIIWVKQRIPAHTMTKEQDYRRLESLALNYKRVQEYQAWIESLRSSIYWQIRP